MNPERVCKMIGQIVESLFELANGRLLCPWESPYRRGDAERDGNLTGTLAVRAVVDDENATVRRHEGADARFHRCGARA